MWECETNGQCDNVDSSSSNDSSNYSTEHSDQEIRTDYTETNERTIRQQDDSQLKDQQSTGRKRAAELFPLFRDQPCEWKMQKNVGGGPSPIMGCLNGMQQARHHGPDKNTLNNDKGNVHRICHSCHNRWHTDNDHIYVFGVLQNEHAPVEASITELAENEMSWAGRKISKVTD